MKMSIEMRHESLCMSGRRPRKEKGGIEMSNMTSVFCFGGIVS